MKKYNYIYLSGPMTGYKDFNHPHFNEIANDLRSYGYNILNPAENDGGDTSKSWDYYLKMDIRQLTECDAIAVLKGWEKSKGAKLEVHVARTLGYDVLDAYTMNALDIKETGLQEAQRLVYGDRNDAYGHPYHDFKRTVGMINSLLAHKLKEELDPSDWALCMICAKMSREVNKPKRDNKVDICGYAETKMMVDQYMEEKTYETTIL